MKKIRVWWESSDDYDFGGQEVIEVGDGATDYDIEEAARETVFDHFGWGYEEVDE
jgi:hypothetical protein